MTDINDKPDSEAELVDLFRELFEPEIRPSDLLLGIGDDAAVIEPGVDPETRLVVTTDMLVEDVHFLKGHHSSYDIGWRTAAVNISDIAAMGAVPRYGVASIAVPSNMTKDDVMQFAKGLKDAMGEWDAFVIGGDLTKSTGKICVSMTLIGETTGRIITRSGAQLGDVIAVTGNLGDSRMGLELLMNSGCNTDSDAGSVLINRHKRPEARVQHGQLFANNDGIHAMMDISDGLGIDLGRLCKASVVGARIFEESLPVSEEFRSAAEIIDGDPLEFIMGGEDFELLITGDRESVEYIAKYVKEESIAPGITIIGEIIDHPFGIHLARVDGSILNPTQMGWDHFRKTGE